MRVTVICLIAAMLTTGCLNQAAEDAAANQAVVKPKAEKAPHCFFKDEETKDWAVKIAGDSAVVTGRAFRSDARYKAVLLEPKIAGRTAEIRPSISTNDTGFATEDNWWDLKVSIPAAAIDMVEVRCGKKVVASLPLPKLAG
ncbi:MAG: hypothetical protein ABIS39_08780 [Sphingomicrobium sp.]